MAPVPMGYGQQGGADAQYWANRQQALGYGYPGGGYGDYQRNGLDRREIERRARYGQPWGQPGYPQVPPVQVDPNGYQAPDPNAMQPDPSLDAQSDGGAQPGD
jgi:hypothetical protein